MGANMMQATTSALGGRVPKQVQRCLPLYIAVIIVILFMVNVDFSSTKRVARLHMSSSSPVKYDAKGKFPRKIWQTWKVDALAFAERDLTCAKTWTSKNPGHRYEVLTDANALYYVETHFGPNEINRPDIIEMYRSLTATIIKADLLRYLIMYVEGGVYADIDVEALRPIERFIPSRYKEEDIGMVIGVEIDQPEFLKHPILGSKSRSFCQWTFMCKPGLPLMLHLIDHIIQWLNDIAKQQNKPIAEIELDFDEVLSGTGPSAFTEAVLAEMSRREGREISWTYFQNLAESRLVGGVLVLTVEAFAAGQGHSDSGNHNARGALVRHRYHASGWPNKHPRYSHPVYGEVERCNWDSECVKLWDINTAAFDSLSPEEKAKMITIKEVADAQQIQQVAQQAAQVVQVVPVAQVPVV